jgi:hypothetical protein
MRLPVMGTSPLIAALIVGAGVVQVRPAAAAAAYCPNPDHARPQNLPADLAPAAAAAFRIDAAALDGAAFVRCVGPKLMACYVGANIPCGKAETHRSLAGATAYCRDNPGATFIPMAATGHATIYQWSCNGRSAVAGEVVAKVDAQGYIADSWKELR